MSKSMVAVGQNPSIQVSRAPIEPPPIAQSGDKWVKRVFPQEFSVPTGTANSLIAPPSSVIGGFIDKVQVWGLNLTRLTASLKVDNCTDLGTDDVTASDYSSQAQLPGITFKVPLGHAKAVETATDYVLSIGQSTVAIQTIVIHYHAWVKL